MTAADRGWLCRTILDILSRGEIDGINLTVEVGRKIRDRIWVTGTNVYEASRFLADRGKIKIDREERGRLIWRLV